MKRVNEYKKLFNVTPETTLRDLKSNYRNMMKDWHPDKFLANDEKAEEAEMMSRKIIDAYHFLVSIAPETRQANLEEYQITTSETRIVEYKHKGLLLEISFSDGTTYEYFGVNERLFTKMHNAEKQFRFAKRNIFNSFLYRKSKKDLELATA